jgi:DNA topoisomerase-3
MDAIRAGCPDMADMIGGADLTRKSHAWDTAKISEHHAIIPTTRVPVEGDLSGSEKKIYRLICARYALQFLQDFEYEETSVEFDAGGELFTTAGRTVINLGWQGWDKQDEPDGHIGLEEKGENAGDGGDGKTREPDAPDGANRQNTPDILPAVRQGDEGTVRTLVLEKTTKPPSPYSYHSLLSAMNNIHVFVKDPGIRAKLKEIQGIGTEATQENIIGVLFKRGYIVKKKKQVVSTELGRLLIDVLSAGKASALVRPDMTALWEKRVGEIEAGSETLEAFVSDVADTVKDMLSERLEIPSDINGMPGVTRKHKCLTDGCDGYLRHIAPPKKSPFFSCPVCRKTFNDIGGAPVPRKEWTGEIVDAPCPLNCGKNARRFEGKYGYYWKCLCSPDVTFKDSGGVPAVREERTETKCPVSGCKGKAIRLTSKKDGRAFWKCGVCGNFFDDADGEPGLHGKSGKKRKK